MGLSLASGPVVITGNTNPNQNFEPDQGPSVEFQGGAVLDPRYVGMALGLALGQPGYKINALYALQYFVMMDGVPQALSNTRIAAAQATVAATPMTLVTAQGTGVSPNIPIIPFGSSYAAANVVTPKLTLDFGFTTGTTVATSKNVTIPAGAFKFFYAGQKIIISGAGSSATTPLFTSVASTPTGTTLVVNDAAGQSVSNAQIGTADNTGIAAWPWANAGAIALADPYQCIARAVSITGNAGSTAQTFTVSGYDIWGNVQTEGIAFAGGAATTNGKKAFKYIQSVTPASTDAGHTLSVGTTDIFGFTLRSDFWEYMNVYYNGAFITASTGWVVADTTSPATATTGDTRGTYAVQSASDGTKRLALFMSMPMNNMINATNLSYTTMFGITPV